MDFSILPKPVHPSEKLKRLTNLHINQQLHLKKWMLKKYLNY